MSNLMLHCGGKPVSRDGLDLVPVPVETSTYKPVAHGDLTRRVLTVSQDLMTGFSLTSESYGIAREGNQMFAVLTFKNTNQEMGLSIGYRNSYDKSMSLGLVAGASVFVCDNLALRGDIEITRKHTGEIWNEIEERLIALCYRAGKNFNAVIEHAETLKALPFDDRLAFRAMGELYGREIISPRQLTVVKAQWLKPDHEAFAPRTAWSLYNACTEALKSSPPSSVIENHLDLTRFFDGEVIDAEEVVDAVTTTRPADYDGQGFEMPDPRIDGKAKTE